MVLMDENLESTTSRLKASLDTWPSWDADLAARPVVVAELNGLSNTSYLIANNNLKLVLRLNSPSAGFGVDRALERTILQGLQEAPFAPTLIHHDEHIDFVVTEYVNGSEIRPEDIDGHLEDIARLFGKIHASPVDMTSRLDPMEQARYYYEQLADTNTQSLSWCYHALESLAIPLSPNPCLCHNDLLLENIVKCDTGLVALDWEYANAGDPAFDLAVFIESYQLDKKAQRRFLKAYPGPAESIHQINNYRLLYRLIEILWWMLRDPDHRSIGDKLAQLEQRIHRNGNV